MSTYAVDREKFIISSVALAVSIRMTLLHALSEDHVAQRLQLALGDRAIIDRQGDSHGRGGESCYSSEHDGNAHVDRLRVVLL